MQKWRMRVQDLSASVRHTGILSVDVIDARDYFGNVMPWLLLRASCVNLQLVHGIEWTMLHSGPNLDDRDFLREL
jgi:hypothetical protein